MKQIIVSIFSLFILTNIGYSHPHVFIDYTTTFIHDNNKLKGIKLVWIFDEMFSSTMLQDYDTNKNKVLEPGEVRNIEHEAFSNLRQYNYFCNLYINKKKLKIKTVQSFSATVLKNRLVYSFFIPIGPRAGSGKNIKFFVRDHTNFCAMTILRQGGCSVKGLAAEKYNLGIKNITIKDANWGPIASNQIVLRLF